MLGLSNKLIMKGTVYVDYSHTGGPVQDSWIQVQSKVCSGIVIAS